MDLLARTAHGEHVEALAEAGVLEARGRRAALDWIRARLDWAGWMDRLLLAVGAALVLSGIVYFCAYNWFSIPPSVKFLPLEAGVAGTAVAAWRVGLGRAGGKMLLMASSVLVGVLLAVFGQVYQTGADTWELFAGWAALIGGWVAIGRFGPPWVLWIVLIDLAAVMLSASTLGTYRTCYANPLQSLTDIQLQGRVIVGTSTTNCGRKTLPIPRRRSAVVARLTRVLIIPLPSTTKSGRPLKSELKKHAERRLLAFLAFLFGGAMASEAYSADGSFLMPDGSVAWDLNQRLVKSFCTVKQYERHKRQLVAFLDALGDALEQEAMASFLLPAHGVIWSTRRGR